MISYILYKLYSYLILLIKVYYPLLLKLIAKKLTPKPMSQMPYRTYVLILAMMSFCHPLVGCQHIQIAPNPIPVLALNCTDCSAANYLVSYHSQVHDEQLRNPNLPITSTTAPSSINSTAIK